MADTGRDDEKQNDHDILIELRTIVKGLVEKVDKMSGNFVTQAEFWPVKALVYGYTGLILTAVIVALITLVVKQ